jgi:uncharacterized coiled-coil protein SlyX
VRSFLTVLAITAASAGAIAQAQNCDEGVIRMADRSGSVVICSALSAQMPQLNKQLTEASRTLGNQQTQIAELTRLVKGLSNVSRGIGPVRQGQMLKNLSLELTRSQRGGDDTTRRMLEGLSSQIEDLQSQMLAAASSPEKAPAIAKAINGEVGDAIAKLELGTASRKLDETLALVVSIKSDTTAIKSDTTAIKGGVASMDKKLDMIVGKVDPNNPADRCADLDCAVEGGASPAAVSNLIAKGVKVPSVPMYQGVLLNALAISNKPGRMEVLDILLANGLKGGMFFHPYVVDDQSLTPTAIKFADDVQRASHWSEHSLKRTYQKLGIANATNAPNSWNEVAGCLLRDSGGVSILELAAMRGDKELFYHLKGKGITLPARPLIACRWMNSRVGSGAASISIAQGVTTITLVASGPISAAPPSLAAQDILKRYAAEAPPSAK